MNGQWFARVWGVNGRVLDGSFSLVAFASRSERDAFVAAGIYTSRHMPGARDSITQAQAKDLSYSRNLEVSP